MPTYNWAYDLFKKLILIFYMLSWISPHINDISAAFSRYLRICHRLTGRTGPRNRLASNIYTRFNLSSVVSFLTDLKKGGRRSICFFIHFCYLRTSQFMNRLSFFPFNGNICNKVLSPSS